VPIVRAFTGLLYDPGSAGPLHDVTAPPYDVITPVDQDRYYRSSPYNMVRVILGKEAEGDDDTANKYTRAGSYLRSWRDEGILVPSPEPSLYPYELDFRFGGERRSIRGIVAEVELEPWGGSIIPHERTLPGPIEDRLSLLRSVRANLSPVYSVFAGPSVALSDFLDAVVATPAVNEVTDDLGTRHRLWVRADGVEILQEALRRERLLIADGHHRYTVSLAFREEMRAIAGPGPWDATMMLIVDAGTEDPPVLPIHRILVRGDLAQEPPADRVRDMAEVLASLRDDELTYGTVRLEEGEPVHGVARLAGSPPTVCALHDQVLDRIRGAELRYVPDSVQAEQAVIAGEAATAYLLPPTRVQRVWEVVADNGRLPQKSTYFWPKPRTGMVIRPFDS
jgi:uncharacterized protein (DUF1015 family)